MDGPSIEEHEDGARREAGGADSADERMAEILRRKKGPRRALRETLAGERTGEAEDLLGRLNALDFIDSLVGETSDIPERLGDYRIRGLLGRGGMGTVYEAFQESLEREVALKVLSPVYAADPTMRARFRSEARATASLHHAHIVPIYDFGETSGVLFFTMEKVHGVSLDKHIAAARRRGDGWIEPREAAARFAGVAEALDHAHRRRILHRDVKPGNLLVGPDGALALVDFGLSKMLGEQSHSLTAGGAFLGTLAYAPPEQARGDAPAPSGDLYSLGVTLFEAVAGELPLRGGNTESMLDALLNGRPKRLREVVPRAPRDLEAVVDKLLQKDPSDRYADGEELARDLRRVAEGEPVRIRRQPWWVRCWRLVKKRPDLWATVAVAGVLGLLSLGLVLANQRVRSGSDALLFDNHLQAAVSAAARQPGPAAGPPGLLSGLVGVEVVSPVGPDEVLVHLQQAALLDHGATVTSTLREAYESDPLPAATQLLRTGRAYRAMQLYDPAIAAARAGLAPDDATWLRLYRLYVGRAVAGLMRAVGDVDQARRDLSAAELVRSAAFFPKLLIAIIDWDPVTGVDPLMADLEPIVAGGPPRAREVAGVLLRAVAGLQPWPGSNLVHFEMSYVVRRELHLRSSAMLPDELPAPATGHWSGFEAELAGLAQDMTFGDAVQQAAALRERMSSIQQDVHPRSPLQSWRTVFEVQSNAFSVATLRVARGAGQDVQLRGWLDLLRVLMQLDSRPPFVDALATRLAELDPPRDSPTGAELRARVALVTADLQALSQSADAWYRLQPGAPAPLLARFEAEVRAGTDWVKAGMCGVELLQNAHDADWARGEIDRVLRAEIDRSPRDSAQREQCSALLAQFSQESR